MKSPEHSLQSWVDRFLDAVVLPPCYTTGIDHPAQRDGSNVAHQMRLRGRGIKPGVGDVYVCQAPSRSIWLELKWGKNKTSDAQDAFANAIWKCGIGYEVCYSIHDVLAALTRAGFRLHGNSANLATEYQARVEASVAKAPRKRATNPFKPKPPTEKARKAWQTYAKLLPIALLCWAVRANAAPPAGITPDPEMTEYYHSLRSPEGLLCCDIADCRNVRVRVGMDGDGSYFAFIDSATFPDDGSPYHGHAPNAWVKVPENVIIHGRENPTAEPIACWYAGELRCFVPNAGS